LQYRGTGNCLENNVSTLVRMLAIDLDLSVPRNDTTISLFTLSRATNPVVLYFVELI
jgi:hypothetical protein